MPVGVPKSGPSQKEGNRSMPDCWSPSDRRFTSVQRKFLCSRSFSKARKDEAKSADAPTHISRFKEITCVRRTHAFNRAIYLLCRG